MKNNEFDIVYYSRTPGEIKNKPIKDCTDIIPMYFDFRNMKMNSARPEDCFFDKSGDGFMRMNVVTHKSSMEQALKRTENQICRK